MQRAQDAGQSRTVLGKATSIAFSSPLGPFKSEFQTMQTILILCLLKFFGYLFLNKSPSTDRASNLFLTCPNVEKNELKSTGVDVTMEYLSPCRIPSSVLSFTCRNVVGNSETYF